MTRRARAPAVPEPPKGLNPAARARWAAVVGSVARHGAVDVDLLATYCQVWVRWQQAEDGIAKTGQLVKSGSRVVASPLVAIAKDAGTQVRALEERLGLGDPPAAAAPAEPSAEPMLTRRQLAKAMNVHMQTVTKWEMDGMPLAVRGRRGVASSYRVSEVRAWKEAREKQAAQSGTVDVAQERARKERAQAVLTEQTFQQRAGKLLPVEDVNKIWAAEIAGVRAVILAGYTTHADRVYRAATLEGLPGVEFALKELAHEVLRELANPERRIERAS